MSIRDYKIKALNEAIKISVEVMKKFTPTELVSIIREKQPDHNKYNQTTKDGKVAAFLNDLTTLKVSKDELVSMCNNVNHKFNMKLNKDLEAINDLNNGGDDDDDKSKPRLEQQEPNTTDQNSNNTQQNENTCNASNPFNFNFDIFNNDNKNEIKNDLSTPGGTPYINKIRQSEEQTTSLNAGLMTLGNHMMQLNNNNINNFKGIDGRLKQFDEKFKQITIEQKQSNEKLEKYFDGLIRDSRECTNASTQCLLEDMMECNKKANESLLNNLLASNKNALTENLKTFTDLINKKNNEFLNNLIEKNEKEREIKGKNEIDDKLDILHNNKPKSSAVIENKNENEQIDENESELWNKYEKEKKKKDQKHLKFGRYIDNQSNRSKSNQELMKLFMDVSKELLGTVILLYNIEFIEKSNLNVNEILIKLFADSDVNKDEIARDENGKMLIREAPWKRGLFASIQFKTKILSSKNLFKLRAHCKGNASEIKRAYAIKYYKNYETQIRDAGYDNNRRYNNNTSNYMNNKNRRQSNPFITNEPPKQSTKQAQIPKPTQTPQPLMDNKNLMNNAYLNPMMNTMMHPMMMNPMMNPMFNPLLNQNMMQQPNYSFNPYMQVPNAATLNGNKVQNNNQQLANAKAKNDSENKNDK